MEWRGRGRREELQRQGFVVRAGSWFSVCFAWGTGGYPGAGAIFVVMITVVVAFLQLILFCHLLHLLRLLHLLLRITVVIVVVVVVYLVYIVFVVILVWVCHNGGRLGVTVGKRRREWELCRGTRGVRKREGLAGEMGRGNHWGEGEMGGCSKTDDLAKYCV